MNDETENGFYSDLPPSYYRLSKENWGGMEPSRQAYLYKASQLVDKKSSGRKVGSSRVS